MSERLESLPVVLTVEEAARVLRISRGSAYEAIRTGALPHVRLGRTIRIPRHMLASLLGAMDDGSAPNVDARSGPGGPQHSQEDERDDDERAVGGGT